MANYNQVLLMGNLTRDPQLRMLPSGTAICEFGMAVNRKWKTAQGEAREEVCFVDCAAFGKQAETINQYCQKGKSLFVSGRLHFDSWEDKQGGFKRSKLSVVVENFQFIGGREQDGGERQTQPPGRERFRKPPPAENPIGDEEHFGSDDIPF